MFNHSRLHAQWNRGVREFALGDTILIGNNVNQRDQLLLNQVSPKACQYLEAQEKNTLYYDWYCVKTRSFLSRNTYEMDTDDVNKRLKLSPSCSCVYEPEYGYRLSQDAARKYRTMMPVNITYKNLSSLRNLFLDVQIRVIGSKREEVFDAHRIVLAAYSPLFKQLFTTDMNPTNKAGEYVLRCSPQYFALWLKIIYSEINFADLSDDQCLRVLNMSSYLGNDIKDEIYHFYFADVHEAVLDLPRGSIGIPVGPLLPPPSEEPKEAIPGRTFELYIRLMLETDGIERHALLFERCRRLVLPTDLAPTEFPHTEELRAIIPYHSDQNNALVQWLKP